MFPALALFGLSPIFSFYVVPTFHVPLYPLRTELQVVVAEISPYEIGQPFKTLHTSLVVSYGTGSRCDFQYAESAAALLLDNDKHKPVS